MKDFSRLNQILKILENREEPTKVPDLAKELGGGVSGETIRTATKRLKEKGHIDGSGEEGWSITDRGREILKTLGGKIPITSEDTGTDTPGILRRYGFIATVEPDVIEGTIEMICSHDPEDLDWVWKCMVDMGVVLHKRRVWFNMWRNYIKQPIPEALKPEVVGARKEEDFRPDMIRPKTRDYIVEADTPIMVGEGCGDYTFEEARQVVTIQLLKARLTSGAGGAPAGGPQGLTLDNIQQILGWIQPQGARKNYLVRQGEEGTVVEEIEEGKPLVIPSQTPNTPAKSFFINPQGELQEVAPGQPIIIPSPGAPTTWVVGPTGEVRQLQPGEPLVVEKVQREPARTFLVNQDGTVHEQLPGQPIIIQPAPNPSQDTTSIPLELTDETGKAIARISMPLTEFIGTQRDSATARQAQQKHEEWLRFMSDVRKYIPAVMSEVDKIIGSRGGKGEAAQAATAKLLCDHCGRENEVPRDAKMFTCTECNWENEIEWD